MTVVQSVVRDLDSRLHKVAQLACC